MLVRVVPELLDDDLGSRRAPFHGTAEQLLADIEALGRQGATEVLLDLNLSHRVGTPEIQADEALRRAERVVHGRDKVPAGGHVRSPLVAK
jgi:hypothetical protein